MGTLSTILAQLGFEHRPQGAAASTGVPPSVPSAQNPAAGTSPAPLAPLAPVPVALPLIDVVTKLDTLAAANAEPLDWKISIVDLLRLLNMDSSLRARKELAAELDCPAEKMADSAQMNLWLHSTVLRKIADSGGNVPEELLH
jgi:hypothetical protein